MTEVSRGNSICGVDHREGPNINRLQMDLGILWW